MISLEYCVEVRYVTNLFVLCFSGPYTLLQSRNKADEDESRLEGEGMERGGLCVGLTRGLAG